MPAFPLPLSLSTIPSALHLYSLTQERKKKRKQESKNTRETSPRQPLVTLVCIHSRVLYCEIGYR